MQGAFCLLAIVKLRFTIETRADPHLPKSRFWQFLSARGLASLVYIEAGMSLSQVYELIGNPHWGLDICFIEDYWPYDGEVDIMLYCYVLSDGQILKIVYDKDNNGNDIVEAVSFCGIEYAFSLSVIVVDGVKS